MSTFEGLSEEGRIQKLRQHLDGGHPVPAAWVSWLMDRLGIPQAAVDGRSDLPAFETLDAEGRLARIRGHVADGIPVPTGWVGWLIVLPASPDPGAGLDRGPEATPPRR